MDRSTVTGSPKERADAIAKVAAELAVAIQELEIAASRRADASREETSRRNNVNALQKRMDELITLEKQSAPRDTDWCQKARQPVA